MYNLISTIIAKKVTLKWLFLFYKFISLSTILFAKYLSCETNNIVPVYSFKFSSSNSLVEISKWLVGSSNIKKFVCFITNLAIKSLTLYPPDNSFNLLNTFSP